MLTPVPHLLPHAPQLFGSTPITTQAPLHSCSPTGHPHVPLPHVAPPVHLMPQPPQLLLSLSSSTHVPPQLFWPPAQHVPSWQLSPTGHELPQVPQLLGSVA